VSYKPDAHQGKGNGTGQRVCSTSHCILFTVGLAIGVAVGIGIAIGAGLGPACKDTEVSAVLNTVPACPTPAATPLSTFSATPSQTQTPSTSPSVSQTPSITASATETMTQTASNSITAFGTPSATMVPLYDVITVAGSPTGQAGTLDGIGTNAKFRFPSSMVYDAGGRWFIAAGSSQIRTFDAYTREVAVYVGTSSGFADGIGTAAKLATPSVLVFSPAHDVLFVADGDSNCRIRAINVSTVEVTTLAGRSPCGYADDIGTNAKFNTWFTGMVYFSGFLFVTDRSNYRIRKVDVTTQQVTTLLGDGTQGITDGVGTSAKFYKMLFLAVDPLGFLWGADDRVIRRVDPSTGQIDIIIGSESGFSNVNGVGTDANFGALTALSINNDGDVLIVGAGVYVANTITLNVTRIAGHPTSGYDDGGGYQCQV
jgi:hypothetical protein